MFFQFVFDLANVVQLKSVLLLRFLEDQPRCVGLSTFCLVVFLQALEFRRDQLQPLFNRIDLSAKHLGAVVQIYDLLRLISMLSFGAVALERVLRMSPTYLRQGLFDEPCPLRCIAEGFFLARNLGRKAMFDIDGIGELLFKTFYCSGKMGPFSSKKLAKQYAELFL